MPGPHLIYVSDLFSYAYGARHDASVHASTTISSIINRKGYLKYPHPAKPHTNNFLSITTHQKAHNTPKHTYAVGVWLPALRERTQYYLVTTFTSMEL